LSSETSSLVVTLEGHGDVEILDVRPDREEEEEEGRGSPGDAGAVSRAGRLLSKL
jgi:hypothetical protein